MLQESGDFRSEKRGGGMFWGMGTSVRVSGKWAQGSVERRGASIFGGERRDWRDYRGKKGQD